MKKRTTIVLVVIAVLLICALVWYIVEDQKRIDYSYWEDGTLVKVYKRPELISIEP